MNNYNILVVDDDSDILEIFSLYLSNVGYKIYTASNSTKALDIGGDNYIPNHY